MTLVPEDVEAVSALFEPATANDLEALAAIDQGSPRPWTVETFRGELGHSPPTVFVLRSADQVLAFVVTRTLGSDLDIVNLAVRLEERRRGCGLRLVRSLLDHAVGEGVRRVFLEVREGNHPARGLYRSLGFRETQRRRGFYEGPVEDAILMGLEIEP